MVFTAPFLNLSVGESKTHPKNHNQGQDQSSSGIPWVIYIGCGPLPVTVANEGL